jgi:hypothetical protein
MMNLYCAWSGTSLEVSVDKLLGNFYVVMTGCEIFGGRTTDGGMDCEKTVAERMRGIDGEIDRKAIFDEEN